MKPLNEKEWKDLQEEINEYDEKQGHLIGVNLFIVKLNIPDDIDSINTNVIVIDYKEEVKNGRKDSRN